jgi:hypothetical protein
MREKLLMANQTARDWLPAIVVAVLLILTAWGNAFALLAASLLGLAVGLTALRRELARGGFLAVAVGCTVAAVVAFMTVTIWAH